MKCGDYDYGLQILSSIDHVDRYNNWIFAFFILLATEAVIHCDESHIAMKELT